MLSIRSFFIAGILWISGTFALYAQERDSLHSENIRQLEEVNVFSNRYTETIPVQKLKGRELERLGNSSVADAIRYFSGIQIKDYGGIGGLKTVNIRSMGTNQIGIFYNGVQLGNAQNGQIDLGKFSMENMEEISLYNGQKSEILLSAKEFGNAGSIYLTSRIPKFENGKNTNLKASVKTGSFELFNPSVLYEYKINDYLSVSLNTEWINSSGKYKFRYRRVLPSGITAYDTTAVRRNGDIDAFRVEGSINAYLDKGILKAHLYHYDSERGIPGAIVNNVWKRGERLWDKNSFVQQTLQYRFIPRLDTKVNLKYSSDYMRYFSDDESQLKIDNIYRQKEIYTSFANKYTILKNWDVSLAYDFQWNQLSDYADFSRRSHWLSLATAFTLNDRFKAQANILGSFINENGDTQEPIPDKDVYTPAVFFSYQPFRKHGLVFRAFYKKSFRMPTINDLYYSSRANLKPEHATQYNFGGMYDITRTEGPFRYFNVGVDIYYNEEKDKIVAMPKDQQLFWTMFNLGKVEIKGLDVTMTCVLKPSPDWSITGKLQYTLQEAIDVTNPTDFFYRDQIPYIPKHSGSAIAMLSYQAWSFNYSFIYIGERYKNQENTLSNYVEPWYTSDISLSRNLSFKSCKLQILAEVNNLFSQDYEVVANYPMPKRNYRLAVSVWM